MRAEKEYTGARLRFDGSIRRKMTAYERVDVLVRGARELERREWLDADAAHKAACGELGRERGKLERGEIKPAALDATIEKATQAAEARALAFKALLAAAPRIGAKG